MESGDFCASEKIAVFEEPRGRGELKTLPSIGVEKKGSLM